MRGKMVMQVHLQGAQAVVQEVPAADGQLVESLSINLEAGTAQVVPQQAQMKGQGVPALGLMGLCKLQKGAWRGSGVLAWSEGGPGAQQAREKVHACVRNAGAHGAGLYCLFLACFLACMRPCAAHASPGATGKKRRS